MGFSNEIDDNSISNFCNSGICLLRALKLKGFNVVTQLKKATHFWPAEDYHQQYYEHKGSEPYCHKKVKRF